MKLTDAAFESLLKDYVDAFITRVSSSSTSQVPIPIAADFAHQCAQLGLRFKTSFGHGNLAAIPWLACFAPGQSAKLEGVYPVLMYDHSTSSATVAYGISATGATASGVWPRQWPNNLTKNLRQLSLKKKAYRNSLVLNEFNSPLATQIEKIAASLLRVIEDFLNLHEEISKKTVLIPMSIFNFHDGLTDAGLLSSLSMTTRLVASLMSKRFCIFTGLAGSGKTKLAEAFALWLSESEDQYRIVAVGADWTSNENLLGYADALREGTYQMPANGVLELIIRASKAANAGKPYFLILDEMNLSHVERYFADFLSAMESSNSKLRLHGVAAGLMAGDTTVPNELALPSNLFIIGTVNVDETTYMFSPKVLDRANVMEFRATAEQMDAFLDNPANINLEALTGLGSEFAQAFVQRSNADTNIDNPYRPRLKQDLLALFATLAGIGAEFGFRSAKEIARFMVIHQELSGDNWQYTDALDAQVLQKLMPKLHGSARKLDGVLKALNSFAQINTLPLTLEKVNRMQERLKRDGFTSFAEA